MSDKETQNDKAKETARVSSKSELEQLIEQVFGDAHKAVQSDILSSLKALNVERPQDLLGLGAQNAQNVIINAFNKRARVIYPDMQNKAYTGEIKQVEQLAKVRGIDSLSSLSRVEFMQLLRESSGNKDVYDLMSLIKQDN